MGKPLDTTTPNRRKWAAMMEDSEGQHNPESAFDSPTFTLDMSIRVDQPVGSMSISPCGRDVVLASRQGLHIIDLDSPYSPPRQLPHRTPWEVADVQWSPFAARDYWVTSTSNQKALVWNLAMSSPFNAIEHVLHAHTRAITDINFSAHHPDILATCAVDSFVYCWDLRNPARPSNSFCDWFAGATQVKWNRQDPHIIASSHDKFLRIWDDRKGAYPLRSIEAHDTKIYGVDWNRVRPSSIVTCSLDKSIKMWDYENPEDEPERVIRTPFPVWRSRHTPFGWGLLAMPQRGNTDLHLFDRRLGRDMQKDNAVPAVHRFEGHQDQVKEFLWRPRGNIVDGIDNREFQLVSWGTDRDLRLHRLDDETLEKIGYQKGKEVFKRLNLTRKDAQYKTFRDEPAKMEKSGNPKSGLGGMHDQGFSSALGGALNAGMSKAPIPLSSGWGEGGFMTSRMQGKENEQRQVSALVWMKGVKIGKRKAGAQNALSGPIAHLQSDLLTPRPGVNGGWDAPDNIGDEITQAADKFSKVTFEAVDISKRTATVSLNGPWASEGKPVYTKVQISFPTDYPAAVPPSFKLEKTASMTDESFHKIDAGLDTLAAAYSMRGRGCLEAIMCYLLGERGLEDSLAWVSEEASDAVGVDAPPSLSSSEDEDDAAINEDNQVQDLEMSGADLPGIMNANAKVPLPKQCGASFAKNGSLVCFFPHKEDKSWYDTSARDEDSRNNRSRRIFQGFGRLRKASPSLGSRMLTTRDDEEEELESDDSFTSSSSSSDPSDTEDLSTTFFRFTNSWRDKVARTARYRRARSTEHSQRSTGLGSALSKPTSTKTKSFVSIHNLESIMPAKKSLAEEYRIFGEGPQVCEHNADVAAKYGNAELANVWQLAKLILYNEVPLDILDQTHRKEPILVVASHAATAQKRRDSAVDVSYDESGKPTKPRLTGRVRWGRHPFAGAWLIDAIFRQFEQTADVQTLAMLSCVFSEPSNKGGVTNALMDLSQQETPMSMKSPAFSLDYFPSAQLAWSFYQPTISIPPSTPKVSHSPIGVYGSAGSSNGQWGSDPTTPFSTGTTPPIYYKSGRSSAERDREPTHSLSTSPNLHPSRRSTSNLTSAFAASLARPFSTAVGTSPPRAVTAGKRRAGPAENSGGVTWGTNTIFGQAVKDVPIVYDPAYSESGSDDEELFSTPPNNVRVVMKNQNLFDSEAGASVALLNPAQSARYRGYRETYANMLMIWGLDRARLEILKFNGMRGYYTDGDEGSLASLGKRRTPAAAPHAWVGLDITERCSKCSDVLTRKGPDGAKGKCRGCSSTRNVTICSLCKAIVAGTYAPCLACGHVLHSSCHREWFEEIDRDCPTGCGCPCPVASLDSPVITLDEEPQAPQAAGRLATVSESLDSKGSSEIWQEMARAGAHRGLHADSATEQSRRGTDLEGGRPTVRKGFAARSQSTIWGEGAKRKPQRRRSRDDIW